MNPYGMGMGMGIELNPNMQYKICSAVQPNYCVDSSQGLFERGDLILYQFHGGANQRFRFIPDQMMMGCYCIVNMQDGAIQAPRDRQDPGDQCYVDRTTGQQGAQRWRVIPGQGQAQGRGVHIVMADGGGFALDIEGERY